MYLESSGIKEEYQDAIKELCLLVGYEGSIRSIELDVFKLEYWTTEKVEMTIEGYTEVIVWLINYNRNIREAKRIIKRTQDYIKLIGKTI